MNTKNNLHNALHKAFENHTEPLNEAQWNRLEGEILKRKKRRLFPFFLILAVMFITAGTTYLLTANYGLTKTSSAYSTKNTIESESKATAISPDATINQLTIENVNSDATVPPGKRSYKQLVYNKEIYPQPIVTEIIHEPDVPIETKETIFEQPLQEPMIESPVGPQPEEEVVIVETPKHKDTIYIATPTKGEKEDIVAPEASKYSFVIAGGYSNLMVKVTGMENNDKMHKDTRRVFEQSNQNLKSNFINLGFDWNILHRYRIGISTGLQYLRVITPVSIDYTLTEVPFWDAKHTRIEGYVTKNPNDALHFNTNNTNYTTYITVPFKLSYSIPINKRNEILLSSGPTFTALVAAKGQRVNLNSEQNKEPGVTNLSKNNYRQLNTGFAGGMQYSFRIKDTWWIGAEGIWQTNPLKYKSGEGSIKNNMQGYMVNLLIKYKI